MCYGAGVNQYYKFSAAIRSSYSIRSFHSYYRSCAIAFYIYYKNIFF